MTSEPPAAPPQQIALIPPRGIFQRLAMAFGSAGPARERIEARALSAEEIAVRLSRLRAAMGLTP